LATTFVFFETGISFGWGFLSFGAVLALMAFDAGSGRLAGAFAAAFAGFAEAFTAGFAKGFAFVVPTTTFFAVAGFRDPEADLVEVFAPDFVFDVAICRAPSRDVKVI